MLSYFYLIYFFLSSLAFFNVLEEDEFIIFWNLVDLVDKINIHIHNIYSWYKIMLIHFCKAQNLDLYFVSESPNLSLIFQKAKFLQVKPESNK